MTDVHLARLEDRIRARVPQLSPTDVATLADLVERLVTAYVPERIYLFGSKARGDWGPDSDFDLMVVVPDNAPPERQDNALAYDALRGTGTAADVLVLSLFSTVDRVKSGRKT